MIEAWGTKCKISRRNPKTVCIHVLLVLVSFFILVIFSLFGLQRTSYLINDKKFSDDDNFLITDSSFRLSLELPLEIIIVILSFLPV